MNADRSLIDRLGKLNLSVCEYDGEVTIHDCNSMGCGYVLAGDVETAAKKLISKLDKNASTQLRLADAIAKELKETK